MNFYERKINSVIKVKKKITGSTDLSFGMQGSLIGLVETLQFQNTQRSEDSFSFLAQN